MPATKLASSEARKTTALAVSSELPMRPSGTCEIRPALICWACSSFADKPPTPGASRGAGAHDVYPNLATLQFVCPRAGARAQRGFGCAMHAEGGHAFHGEDGRALST